MEYIPAPALINVIVTELLSEDDKETLKLSVGNKTITVGEELTRIYGRMGINKAYSTVEEATIYAARIIYRNRFNLKKLKKINELATLLEDPTNFGNRTITTPDVLQVVNEFRGYNQKTTSQAISSQKNRSGASDESEESDIFDDGTQEDGDLINAIVKQGVKDSIEITGQKDEQGKLDTSINKAAEAEVTDLKLSEKQGEELHMHSINVGVNRIATFNNSANSSVTGVNKSSQTKGVTEVLNIVKSQAFNEYLNAQVIDIRSRFVDQLGLLFTPERYR